MALHPAGRPAPSAGVAPVTAGPSALPATPRDAVSARCVLSAASSVRLTLGDTTADLLSAHAVLPDGTIVLAVDAMSRTGGLLVAARGHSGAVRLDVTHLAPVAVRSRVRARLRIVGTARRFDPAALDACDPATVMSLLDLPPVALWALAPDEIVLDRAAEPVAVDLGTYRAARPDPIAVDEAAHLAHLARCHGDLLDRLGTLVDRGADGTRIVPVALDAEGIVLRAERSGGHTDTRLSFARPVTAGAGLAEALRTLLA
ncbi:MULTISPECIES: DUF2470 domain-containing protein [unclassified Micromonospora]|uniref:DUF2470 domain-containing protein n=1 Tax=unclassified Micromonospora TaxID=2617518 RepID=UPI00188F303D|nr:MULTISPECIES: DUF2470 domain-containing protein [unclassified Micromonospora]MBF5033170.1 DUF2470 domain-containing protein [Micromonospora sp. ANENR4]MCZ7476128.1 DUF2470 domain-containing protein [Micromonospora sp. WMMC273]WBC00990.1 DUF2470 domain-containing protein [Micromonospora sp. WMMA1976]